MKKKYQRCIKGLWDTMVPGIVFDETGVSNYAKIQQKLMEKYPRGNQGIKDWEKIVTDAKKECRGKYDCLVGFSGGVDSSYLLYLLKEKYHLNPLALNLDNGWNTDIAVENLQRITTSLGIDLVTLTIDFEEMKDLTRAYMKAGLPWIDFPSDAAIKSVMYKYALKEKIKYIFRGNDFRSEGKQPRQWTYGDYRQLRYIHGKYGRIPKLKSYPTLSLLSLLYCIQIKGTKDIRPFYYLDYSKSEARLLLEKKFGWKYYGGHHYENIFTKYTMAVWLPDKFGIDKRVINLSAQVLSGAISLDTAKEELSKPAVDNEVKKELIALVVKKLDLNQREYDQIWTAPNKSYLDYPSYEKMLINTSRFMKPLLKLIYHQVPMIFVEMEMNRAFSKQ